MRAIESKIESPFSIDEFSSRARGVVPREKAAVRVDVGLSRLSYARSPVLSFSRRSDVRKENMSPTKKAYGEDIESGGQNDGTKPLLTAGKSGPESQYGTRSDESSDSGGSAVTEPTISITWAWIKLPC